MKTKVIIKISAILLVLVLCLLALVGCGINMDLPSTDAAVTGNGGLAVKKGEYIYFVNGYQNATDLKSGDNKGGNKYSAIYRTKLENGELKYNENGELENCEIIIDKICGFEKTALYIFDDCIYYATPNTEKVISDDKLSNNFELTDFYRAKLDGTNRTHLYKTTRTSNNTDFAFYKVNQEIHLVIYDGTGLVMVNCSNGKATEVCENVSSVALPKYANYNAQNNQIAQGAQNVYYTRSGSEDENLANGNVLCYASIGESEEHIIASGYNTYTVKLATNEALVYSKKSAYDLNANNYVIKYNYNSDNELSLDVQNAGIQLDTTANSEVYLCTFENGNQMGIIVKNSSNKLVYINYQTDKYQVLNEETTLTPLYVYGTKVYAYSSDNSIYQIDYKTLAQKILFDVSNIDEEVEINTPYFSANKNFSVCGGYIYYFAQYEGDSETGYYLNRITTAISENYTVELVGVVQTQHIATKAEE